MNTHEDNRRPEEIESDIARTRAEVSSTIDAIQSKLTPGQMMDQALQYLRGSGASEFGANLGRSVRDNPMPVALVGVGLAWMMMTSGRNGPGPRAWRDDRYVRRVGARDATGTGYADEPDWLAEDLDGPLHDDAEPGLGSRVKDRVAGAAERVKDAVSDTTGRTRDLAHDARERLSSVSEGVRSRAHHLADTSKRRYDRARHRTMRVIDEQPLVLGALGVAIGAALGAALPTTRREDALMGEMRDDLLDGAGEVAREQMGTVKASAQRVAETAREEIERVVEATPNRASTPTAGASATTAPGTAGVAPATGSGTPGMPPATGSGAGATRPSAP